MNGSLTRMGGGGADDRFVHVIESPYEDFDDDFTQFRACEITLDRTSSTAAWHVDGHKLYEAHGTLIPERARISFGIYTQLPIRDSRSQSPDGQGMDARWRRVRVRGVDACGWPLNLCAICEREQGEAETATSAPLGGRSAPRRTTR